MKSRRQWRMFWWSMVYGLWSLLAALVGGLAAGAHSEESAISVRTYAPITVDGTLDDWARRLAESNWTGQLELRKGQVTQWIRAMPIYVNTLTSRVESGTVKGPDDFSAVVYALWDAAQFYVAAVVTDDGVVTQHTGGDIWQDDMLELWFDCRHDAVTHTLTQDDEYQLGFSPASKYRAEAVAWAWRNPRAEGVARATHVASALTPTGYIVEGAVPWAALHGCAPAIGGMIGFNVSMVDKDEDQLWSHVTWSGQLHSDPSQFGHLYFMDAPVDLFPSDVFEVPAGSSLTDTMWGAADDAQQRSNRR